MILLMSPYYKTARFSTFVLVIAFSSLFFSGKIILTIIIYLYNPHEIVQELHKKNCMIPQSTNI